MRRCRLAQWGVAVPDPAAQFALFDSQGEGQVSFEQFTRWALGAESAERGDALQSGAVGEGSLIEAG